MARDLSRYPGEDPEEFRHQPPEAEPSGDAPAPDAEPMGDPVDADRPGDDPADLPVERAADDHEPPPAGDYAIVDHRTAADDPASMVRRIRDDEGIADEALHADMAWHGTGTIAEWKRGEHEDELVEIPAERVQATIDRLRERWRAVGVLETE